MAYSPNVSGGPFAEGDDRSRGWPSYLTSIKTDTENKDEVIGGKLVVWAPDANQQFPTGYGKDGFLFTSHWVMVQILDVQQLELGQHLLRFRLLFAHCTLKQR